MFGRYVGCVNVKTTRRGTESYEPHDHEALRWILKMSDATGKLDRWSLRLQEIALYVVNRAGINNQATDAL